ncbi:hypothetical protein L3X38_034826 [Prunus dulcis]|uniref:glutathione transferase n=1 Tax=Prunus dulcis TaxID=3755 RepID=A0AAD4VK87_PRUDU|nr:hypothetical protein L3X38_034826 [Prunus dulcis]
MAEAEEVKHFGIRGSPLSLRVDIALRLKGVKSKFCEEDLQNKSPLLIKYNPVHKKVPVLVHNEKPIAESLVILEYIDETWKHQGLPILPQDPYQRANARFWASFIDEKCSPAICKAYWEIEGHEKAMEEACELLQFLENELKDNKFFGGETIGFVDMAASFIGYWLRPIQEAVGVEVLTKEKCPKLYDWCDEFASHSVVREVLPPNKETLIAFFLGRCESTKLLAK